MLDKIKGLAVATKLNSYSAANPISSDYPAQDLQKLETIAKSVADRLPGLTKDLTKILPKALPPEAGLPPDARNAATKLGEHLLKLAPASLRGQLDSARDRAPNYEEARKKYGKIRSFLPSVPYFTEAVPKALVAFATNNNISPAELATFENNLKALQGMIPLVDMAGPDLVDRLTKLEELLSLATTANGAVPASP